MFVGFGGGFLPMQISHGGFGGGFGMPMMVQGGGPALMMMTPHGPVLVNAQPSFMPMVVDDDDWGPQRRMPPSRISSGDRESRLREGPSMTLYHQTNPEAASAILGSQRMNRGSEGLAGGGIYFAESPAATERKAHQHGVILSATVRLGSIKYLDADGDRSTTFHSLQQEGHDSTRIARPGGTEYCVYNSDQVSNIRRV